MHSQQLLTHTQEQHSVVQLVTNPPRFMLLPISGYSSYGEKHTGFQEVIQFSITKSVPKFNQDTWM